MSRQHHNKKTFSSRPRTQAKKPEKVAVPSGRWAIGLHAVREVLKVRPKAIAEVWLKEGWESSQDLREVAESTRQKIQVKPVGVLDKLGNGHQGVAVRVSEGPSLDWENLNKAERAVVLLADGLQDPHNLGAILRTAWLLNVQAIFITENRSASMTPSVMKVASGGAEHVPVVVDGNLLEVAKSLKDMGFWLYGLAGESANTLWQIEFPEKVALVVGNEESGIRTPLARLCDELVCIPQVAAGASFNASVAAAIALSNVARQHSQSAKKS